MSDIYLTFVLIMGLMLTSSLALDSVISVESSIVNVTVFGTAAIIFRKAILPLSSVSTSDSYLSIIITGLPGTLVDSSLRISGYGPSEILGSELSQQMVQRSESAEYRIRMKEIVNIKSSLSTKHLNLFLEKSRLSAKEKYLLLLVESTFSSGKGSALAPDIAKAKETLAYMESELIEVHKRLLIIDTGLSNLETALADIEAAVLDFSTNGVWKNPRVDCVDAVEGNLPFCTVNSDSGPDYSEIYPSSSIEKKLSVRAKVNLRKTLIKDNDILEFYVSYLAAPAQWSPEYDIFVESADSKDGRGYQLQLGYYAAVQQRTRENWSAVKLALSTVGSPNIASHSIPHGKGVHFQDQNFINNNGVMFGGVAKNVKASRASMRMKSMSTAASFAADGNTDGDVETAEAFVQMDPMPMMAMASGSGSYLGVSYTFKVDDPVYITSSRYKMLSPESIY